MSIGVNTGSNHFYSSVYQSRQSSKAGAAGASAIGSAAQTTQASQITQAVKAAQTAQNTQAAPTTQPAQTLDDFKKEMYDTIGKMTIHPSQSKTQISINISDKAFQKMMDDPSYKKEMLRVIQRDLNGAYPTVAAPSYSVIRIGDDCEYRADSMGSAFGGQFAAAKVGSFMQINTTSASSGTYYAQGAAKLQQVLNDFLANTDKTSADILVDYNQRYPELDFSSGYNTKGAGASGLGNVILHPKLLEKMAADPEFAAKTEETLKYIPQAERWLKNMLAASGQTLVASGCFVDENGNITGSWSYTKTTNADSDNNDKNEKDKKRIGLLDAMIPEAPPQESPTVSDNAISPDHAIASDETIPPASAAIIDDLIKHYSGSVHLMALPDWQADKQNFQNQLNHLSSYAPGTSNIVIAPNMLEKMAKDPEAKHHYMGQIQSYFDSLPQGEAFLAAHGHEIISSGVIVHEDGTVTSWCSADLTPEKKAELEQKMKEEDEEKAQKRIEANRPPAVMHMPFARFLMKKEVFGSLGDL